MGSVQSGGGGGGGVPLLGAVSGEGKGREWGNFGGTEREFSGISW